MKLLVAAAAFFVGVGLIGVSSSQAMPLAPGHAAGATAIVRVIEGCGANGHRGPGGNCRPRYNCPAGWHSGPDGWHCFPNR
jgi:hypothetical protein